MFGVDELDPNIYFLLEPLVEGEVSIPVQLLDEDDKKGNAMNIVSAIDSEKKLNACILSLEHCNNSKPCPLHHIINPTRTILMNNLKTKTIAELSLDVKEGKAFLPL